MAEKFILPLAVLVDVHIKAHITTGQLSPSQLDRQFHLQEMKSPECGIG